MGGLVGCWVVGLGEKGLEGSGCSCMVDVFFLPAIYHSSLLTSYSLNAVTI